MNFYERALELKDELVANRRYLHTNAEVGLHMPIAKAYVMEKLKEYGIEPMDCGEGVTATVGNGNGKVLLLRADMDALPMSEESGLDFASQNGCAHTCGHDCHAAMLLTAAKMLKENEYKIEGTVKFMFQPAEETMDGAKMMVEHGVCDGVDLALGMHVYTNTPMPVGSVILMGAEARMAAVDRFTIHIQGKGCHGAYPHTGVDPLNVMCHIHLALQAINAREMDPLDNIVLTIGQMQGGNTANVIPSEAMMSGSIRTLKNETRAMVKARTEAIVSGIAATFNAAAYVEWGSGCPVLYHNHDIHAKAKEALKSLDGVFVCDMDNQKIDMTSMGSEDFAYVANTVPSVYFGLAAGRAEDGCSYPLHHPKAKFMDECLAPGAATYAHVAMELLK